MEMNEMIRPFSMDTKLTNVLARYSVEKELGHITKGKEHTLTITFKVTVNNLSSATSVHYVELHGTKDALVKAYLYDFTSQSLLPEDEITGNYKGKDFIATYSTTGARNKGTKDGYGLYINYTLIVNTTNINMIAELIGKYLADELFYIEYDKDTAIDSLKEQYKNTKKYLTSESEMAEKRMAEINQSISDVENEIGQYIGYNAEDLLETFKGHKAKLIAIDDRLYKLINEYLQTKAILNEYKKELKWVKQSQDSIRRYEKGLEE